MIPTLNEEGLGYLAQLTDIDSKSNAFESSLLKLNSRLTKFSTGVVALAVCIDGDMLLVGVLPHMFCPAEVGRLI